MACKCGKRRGLYSASLAFNGQVTKHTTVEWNIALRVNVNNVSPYPTPQLEDIDILVADHVQRVHKTNFLASWDEIGDECEMQDTYALTQMNSLEGKNVALLVTRLQSHKFFNNVTGVRIAPILVLRKFLRSIFSLFSIFSTTTPMGRVD